ncbi:hypothetical protein C0J52_08494 [Blattella germanica]|nr:hypothetical protein C0J52_08494 [Blattella germanica]
MSPIIVSGSITAIAYLGPCTVKSLGITKEKTRTSNANWTIEYKEENFSSNLKFGCNKIFTQEETKTENLDEYELQTINCPLHFMTSQKNCSWKGTTDKVREHVRTEHKQMIIDTPSFMCSEMKNIMKLIYFNGELFMYYKNVNDNMMYAVVRKTGITSHKFRCVYNLKSKNEKNPYCIRLVFYVGCLDRPISDVLNFGKCLILESSVIRNFVQNNQINFSVTIELCQ